ncbi:type IV secretion system protein (plasmid) [Acinetobacter baumannii]|mgnify:CR=1 FL=1|jgi:P-type conjugative transfer protein TrbJ|uniref:type IV secretion system protein n=1 Tax=Acinetobacter TaxID=469 RepID=UPI0019AC24AF|nr:MULTISPECIES: type IV secretion system protein [Acinetobacter]MBC6676415.1 conjugal transfer protein TrbJ [Acinetobacter sp.]WNX68949.1 type IV secretion system protein [Acinetobacter baumannii]
MKIKAMTLAVLLACGTATSTSTMAGIPVFDGSNFANMIISASNQAQQISNQVSQINSLLRGNALSEQALRQLGLGNYSGLLSQMSAQYQDLNKIITASKALSASVSEIQSQYQQLYPNFQNMKNRSPEQMYQQFGKWSDQLQDANKSAMQAQSTINNIKDRNNRIASILNESAGGAGASQVAQLQSSNQMLGVLAQQMNDLHTVMASSARSATEAQAMAQAEKDAMRNAWKQRNTSSLDLSSTKAKGF